MDRGGEINRLFELAAGRCLPSTCILIFGEAELLVWKQYPCKNPDCDKKPTCYSPLDAQLLRELQDRVSWAGARYYEPHCLHWLVHGGHELLVRGHFGDDGTT